MAGLVSVSIAVGVSVPLGLVSGYLGGVVDGLLMRVIDAMLAIPFLILAIALAAFLGPNLINAMIAIGVVQTPIFTRLTRAQALAVKHEDYIEAARAVGNPHHRIMMRHILPNVLAPILVQATLAVAAAILAEAALSYLGLGQQPPAPSWGSMLNIASHFLSQAPWMAVRPGLAIFSLVLSFNLLGDGLPRRSRSASRLRRGISFGTQRRLPWVCKCCNDTRIGSMPTFTTRPEIRGTFGVVASTHWIASAVGMSILEKGGNAFDAAAAAGFTLQVVEPHLNGPLGEAPILVWCEANRRCEMICGQGVAPAAATIVRFSELGLDLIPGTGLLAAAVPAAFGAWTRLLRDYGTMKLSEILSPAIGYAENGYPMARRVSEVIAVVADMFRREWPSSAAVYLPHGKPPEPGQLFRNPVLAATYRRILAEAGAGSRERQIERARAAWYRGFVAEAIDQFCRHEKVFDASGGRHGGLLTGDDLARWEAPVE